MNVLAWHVAANPKWSATALKPYSGLTLKSPISGNIPSEHNFKWHTCSSTLWAKKIYINSWSMVNGLVEWSGARGRRLEDKEVGGRDIPMGMDTKCGDPHITGSHSPESIQHRGGIKQTRR